MILLCCAVVAVIFHRFRIAAGDGHDDPPGVAGADEAGGTMAEPSPDAPGLPSPPMPPGLEARMAERGLPPPRRLETGDDSDVPVRLPPIPGAEQEESEAGDEATDFETELEALLIESGYLQPVNEVTALDLLKGAVGAQDMPLDQKLDLVAQLRDDELMEALELVAGMEWGPEAEQLFASVMSRWGSADPVAALDYARAMENRRVRDLAVSRVLNEWAEADPRAAFEWFVAVPEEEAKALGASLQTLFKGLSVEDTAWALDQVWLLPSRSMKTQALRVVLRAMTQQGVAPERLIQVYDVMAEGDDRALLARSIIDTWTRYQPAAAAAWVDRLASGPSRERAIDRLVTSWGQDDPVRAAEWVAGFEDQDTRSIQLGRLMQVWVRSDPAAASAWLSALAASPDLDPAIHSLVRGVMDREPEAAWTWAEQVDNESARHRLLQQVGRAWLRDDRDRAANRISGSALPENIKSKLLALQ